MNPIIYRISIINDFRSTFAFCDFKKFGEVKLFGSLWTQTVHRGYDKPEDHIYLFLNYEQQFKTKSKTEALLYLSKLIVECPPEMCRDLNECQYKLFKAIGDKAA